jgi:dipeptidyl aminopeptidase/acylaminoacyl peptidase
MTSITAWFCLKKLGAEELGVIGASLGGYIAGLITCLTDQIAFAAMMVPAVKFTDRFGPETMSATVKADPVLKDKIYRLWTLHSPLNFMPKIHKDRILVIASKGDKVCPFEPVKELCEKWGWPLHVFLTGGHWLMLNAAERGRAWYRFLNDMDFIV